MSDRTTFPRVTAALLALLFSPAPSAGDETPSQPPLAKSHPAAEDAFAELDSLIALLIKSDSTANPSRPRSKSAGFISHQIRRGESVDAIVRKYYGALPFKPSLMRRLVTGLNPVSVAAKNKLVTGKTLILPAEATVRTALLRSDLGISEAADLLGVAPAGTETDSSTWVHYP